MSLGECFITTIKNKTRTQCNLVLSMLFLMWPGDVLFLNALLVLELHCRSYAWMTPPGCYKTTEETLKNSKWKTLIITSKHTNYWTDFNALSRTFSLFYHLCTDYNHEGQGILCLDALTLTCAVGEEWMSVIPQMMGAFNEEEWQLLLGIFMSSCWKLVSNTVHFLPSVPCTKVSLAMNIPAFPEES